VRLHLHQRSCGLVGRERSELRDASATIHSVLHLLREMSGRVMSGSEIFGATDWAVRILLFPGVQATYVDGVAAAGVAV
jgi:hypothetical protein